MLDKKKICFLTPSHVCCNPRLVKEADALQEAGYDVHVIAARYFPKLDEFDNRIFEQSHWTHEIVNQTAFIDRSFSKIQKKLACRQIKKNHSVHWIVAADAHQVVWRKLASRAIKQDCDAYMAHCLAALPAAAFASQKKKVPFGFDAEDFHTKEILDRDENKIELKARDIIEKDLLPKSSYFSASSPQIAQAYENQYGITPHVILNVFPNRLNQTKQSSSKKSEEKKRVKFYWFSQTIGPGRGLETFLDILSSSKIPFEFHFRGLSAFDYEKRLQQKIIDEKLDGILRFHPLAHADEMVGMAENYDFGLSFEQRVPLNRDLCLTNKIFTYLAAGIPIILSKTKAQEAIGRELGNAAVVLDFENKENASEKLKQFIINNSDQREQSLKVAREKFNWEVEKRKFISHFNEIF